MEKINLAKNTPNLDKLARDSRPGTTSVSLKVKNKTYSIFKKVAEENDTSVGAMINELLNNYVELDKNYSYGIDEKENAKQLVKDKMIRLGKKIYNFSDIELAAFICEQKGLYSPYERPFDAPQDVENFITDNNGDRDISLNTVSAPIIFFDDKAAFSIDDWDSDNFPIYLITIRKKYAKLILALLSAYVGYYNMYILHENFENNEVPCIIEKQFRELVDIMNEDLEKRQIIDKVVEVLTNAG